ncbi:MAG: TRAP transporter small permease [Flavobacteriaceae bacterium]
MRDKIDRILEYILVGLFSLMLASVIWQVFSRFVLGVPSTITDEISSFGLIWVGLLGAAYATGKSLHLAIDLLPGKIVQKRQLWFNGFVYMAIALFSLLVLITGGGRLCWVTFLLQQKSAALEIPLGFIYLVLPLGGILILYYSIDQFWQEIKSVQK